MSEISRLSAEEIAARAKRLEEQLLRAEANEEWDALEPELIELRAAIYRELTADRADLETSKSEYKRKYGPLAHLNPFDKGARDKWKNTVSRKQFEVENDQGIEDHVRRLTEKFYADKTRKFARELIRVTEKIQRDVHGSWEMKAGAVAGAMLSGRDGDEAIARAGAAKDAILRAGFIGEGSLMAAAVLSELGADRAAELAIEVRDATRGAYGNGAEAIGVAAIVSGRTADDAKSTAEAIERELGGDGERGRDREAKGIIAAAVIAAGWDAARGTALVRALDGVPRDGMRGSMAQARVAAAAILSERPEAGVRRAAEEAADLLRLNAEKGSMWLAAAILSPRAPEAAVELAREVSREVHGSAEAEAMLVSAAVVSRQSPHESIAFAKHLQSSLSGTWESEAKILGAALIANGLRGAGGESGAGGSASRLAAAYLIPNLIAPPGEE